MSHVFRQLPRQLLGTLLVGLAVSLAGLALPPAGRAAESEGAPSLFWSNSGASVISSARLDGSGGGDFAFTGTTVTAPEGTAIDAVAGVVYWANSGNNTISWARLNGPGATLNTTGATVNQPRGLAIDPATAKRVYWANSAGGPGGNGTISWAALSGAATPGGGDLPITGADVTSPYGVAVNPGDGTIYWANSAGPGTGPGPGSIMSARADGSDVAAVPITGADVNSPRGLALDPENGRVYWANSAGGSGNSGTISYWNLDTDTGGDLSTTAPIDHPEGIAIDPVAGRLYWANRGNDTIAYSNLDGSGGGTLATTGATAAGPTFPVLLVKPAGTGAPQITGTATVGSTLTCQKASWAGDVLPAFYYRAPRNITWQWSRDGTDISGATTTSYTPTAAGSYTCREMAKNHAGITPQTSDPFIVSAQPEASTAEASSVTATSAVLNGTVIPHYAATAYHFDYGLTTDYGHRVPASDVPGGSDDASHAVEQAISGLEPNRIYHFRLVATNANGASQGADRTFTTNAKPVVATGIATSVTTMGAVLNGSVNPENLDTGYYFQFGQTVSYGARVPVNDAPAGSDQITHAVSQTLAGLTPNTTYHFRLVAVNHSGTSYGADARFTTLPQPPPVLSVPGRVGTVGRSLRLTLACAGALGQHCQAAVVARVFETLSADGRQIIGLSAVPLPGHTRTVVVASGSYRLRAGTRRDVTLQLNAAGLRLRSRFRTVPAQVRVTRTLHGRTRTIRKAAVTFGPNLPRIRILESPPGEGPTLTVRLGCGGTAGQHCTGVLEVTTFERLAPDGRTITGLSRVPAGDGKLVTIARAGYRIPARSTIQRAVTLTATGRTLLERFGRIPATLIVTRTEHGYSLTGPSADVTFTR